LVFAFCKFKYSYPVESNYKGYNSLLIIMDSVLIVAIIFLFSGSGMIAKMPLNCLLLFSPEISPG
jgi:hypothetical protein